MHLELDEVNLAVGVSFHPSGRWLAASGGPSVTLWPLSRHDSYRLAGAQHGYDMLRFTAGSDALVSTRGLWPLFPGAGPGREYSVKAVATHPEDRCLAVSSHDGVIYLVCPPEAPRELLADGLARAAMGFDPSGRFLATGTYWFEKPEEHVVQVTDLETGDVRSFPILEGGETADAMTKAVGHIGFGTDGGLYTAGFGGLRRWDPSDGSSVWIARSDQASMSLSRDGRVMLSASASSQADQMPHGRLTLYDLEHGTSRPIGSHGSALRSLALGASGRVMATGSEDGAVRVSRTEGGGEPHLLLGHDGAVFALAISPDGRWIASEADDGIRLWPMPDLGQPPLHTVPLDELTARLDALTNLRVVEDPDSTTGWSLEVGPFPGWERFPTW
jgi:WD40 repeat protein